MARYGEAQRKAVGKYFKTKYSHISVAMPIAEANALAKAAKESGSSINGYIREAVKMRIEEERRQSDVNS